MNAGDLSRLQTEIATQGIEIKHPLPSSTEENGGSTPTPTTTMNIPAVVTPRAVPITASRLQEIISLYTTKLGHITVVPTNNDEEVEEDNPRSNVIHSTTVSSASDPDNSCTGGDIHSPHGNSNGTLPPKDIPIARVFAVLQSSNTTTATDSSPNNATPTSGTTTMNNENNSPSSVTPVTIVTDNDDELPTKGPFKRLRRFWKRHRYQIFRTTLIVLGASAIIAVFIFSPIAGIFILGNVLLVFGAGAAASAANNSWASTNTVNTETNTNDSSETFSST